MVGMGEHDALENRYMPKFEVLLSESGVVLNYRRDRAGIDTGLHLFVHDKTTTTSGLTRPYWRALSGRVWFQLKGIHASTMSATKFRKADRVAVEVGVDHLQFWYAAPEPVYLVAYVESVDTFVGIDVRDLVEGRWGESFYAEMRSRRGQLTVHIPADAVMDSDRIAGLVDHRSMRIDGPAFRGRPLGHRIDPLRSVLAAPAPSVWTEMVTRVLQAHDFREVSRHAVGELVILHGALAQTLLWQSPAFAEYGYAYAGEVRIEPPPEQVFGDVCVILDAARDRTTFAANESEALSGFIRSAVDNDLSILVFFLDKDLSVTGGGWRRSAPEPSGGGWHQVGLDSLTYLVLTTTLVYLEFAPSLNWDHTNYLN